MIKKYSFRFLLGWLFLLVFALTLDAQERPRTFGPPSFVPDSLQANADDGLPDTIILKYFYLSDIKTFYDYKDSTLDNFFHQYDPAKRRDIDYLNLGNAGSAARNMKFESKPYIGFNSGLNQYDLYNYELEKFRFFENNIPHSDVFFTPVGGQQNFVIRSDFSRDFSDNTSLSLNYQRIRQEGFYANQLVKTTNFGTSLRYKGLNERLTGFASMISNVNEEGHNGGIRDATQLTDAQFNDRLTVPTVIEDGQTRYQQKLYSLINYFQLNKPKTSKVQLLLRYDLTYDRRYYKYTDAETDTELDSMFYGQFITEDRGIRSYIRINRFGNAFYAYAGDGDRLDIRGGIVYDRYSIDETGISSSFDNVYLDFQGDVPITKSLAIQSEAKLGLLDGSGDFLAKGSLQIDLGKWIEMNGGASFYRYTPSLTQRGLVINGLRLDLWENNFTKPIGSDFFGEFHIPLLKLRGKVIQSLITNMLYYNQEAIPTQLEDIFSATSLTLSNEFRIGKMGMENYLLFQIFSDNVFNLPTFHSKHNVHIQGYLFKRALFARLGAEVRLTPAYEGARFNPVIGSFYQSDQTLDFYPMTDIYFTGKIQAFRFFLRFENVVNLLEDEVQYQTVNYPQFDYKVRFGISWLLFN
ncbi:MAG: putative porin [Bacteroidota bacterium]